MFAECYKSAYICITIKTNNKMKATFEKTTYNENFDHQSEVKKIFSEMGYTNFKIETSLTNGCSHYISLNVEVLNEGKCYADMFVYENKTSIQVRISDHFSGLEKNCGGVCGNKMTLNAFKKLIQTGAIAKSN